ncbi:MAG: hypothetical protein J7M26_02380 [Armatimonadetes bacterium]|nr:hypothetical protein [Armatimonadota bacterium]
MALEFEVDQVLAVDGEDYVVRAVTRLVATHFSWQLAELAPAAGGETMLLAEGDGQLYEARLLQAELEPLSSTAEGQGAEVAVGQWQLRLLSRRPGSLEKRVRGATTVFDRGEVLEYGPADASGAAAAAERPPSATPDRAVVFASERNRVGFAAERRPSSGIAVYGRA